jgi:putative cell wall-binding protein
MEVLMQHGSWWKNALRCLTAVALLGAFAPVQAAGARGITVQDIKRSGLRATAAIRTADESGTVQTYSIKGHIGHGSGDWTHAAISAVPFSKNASGTWDPIGGVAVESDGSYSIDGMPAGTYRIGFLDSNRVYSDLYYQGVSTKLDDAADVSVVNTDVAGVDDTVTALPERSISGKISFVGADPAFSAPYVEFYKLDPATNEWAVQYSVPAEADGSFTIHTDSDGEFRLGFTDFADGFFDTFYANASTVESATGVVVTAGTPVTGINQTVTAKPSVRIGGTDAIDTSIKLSQDAYPDMYGGTIVLCTADNWPDSLAGGSYAYSVDGPMLLTHKSSIPASVISEIQRLAPEQIVILGSPAAVSVDVEIAVREIGVPIVRRIQGNDRYQTAAQVARELMSRGLVGNADGTTDFALATGANYADAMSGSAVAASMHMPILLVQQNAVPTMVKNLVAGSFTPSAEATANEGHIMVFGSSNAISDGVVNTIAKAGRFRCDYPEEDQYAADNVTRLEGSDRYGTSAAIADFAIMAGFSPRAIAISNGTKYDALCSASILAKRQQALLLVSPALTRTGTTYHMNSATEGFLDNNKGMLARITAIGGTPTVSDNVFKAALFYSGITTVPPTGP